MLARLPNSIRIRAGRLLALVYLLCVLAPATALALGDLAPCLQAEASAVQTDTNSVASLHIHDAGSHDHGGRHVNDGHAHHHHGKTSSGPCCAMLCLSAVPAELPSIVKPSQPVSVLVSVSFRPLRGEAPPLLYRPPIA